MRRLRRLWCRMFHDQPMWPRATYECRRCGERFENPMLDGPIRGRDLL